MKKTEAVFAGGCFWCLQEAFDNTKGVIDAECGYSGGKLQNPTYNQVCSGIGGHYEVVKVLYDEEEISYSELLEVFWATIDPENPDGQFCDVGSQYETAIFYLNEYQRKVAENQKEQLKQSNIFSKIETRILPFQNFYSAEEYHQKYYKKNPKEYKFYYENSGRLGFKNKFLKVRKFFINNENKK